MKKSIGKKTAVFPMPVLIVAAYDETGKVNLMNAAWGMVCDYGKIALFLSKDHKTTKNILSSKAFTVSIADLKNLEVADYVGMVSGNEYPDKFERTRLHQTKSKYVNAPIIDEFPIVMECSLADIVDDENMFAVIGAIENTSADVSVLDEKGEVDTNKIQAILFDEFHGAYRICGGEVGNAWTVGRKLM